MNKLFLSALCCGTTLFFFCSPHEIAKPTPPFMQTKLMQTHSTCIFIEQCSTPPILGPTTPWHHSHKSPVSAEFGSPSHRGIDLIALENTSQHKIVGELHYGVGDKSLEQEDVEIYACQQGKWNLLGEATTDKEGQFTLVLEGEKRLPVGLRPLFVSVKGDRSHFLMKALVLPPHGKIVVSDIDGTLTSSEGAYPKSFFSHEDVLAHEGAKEVLTTLVQKCYQPVYVTARGDRFTEATRTWLKSQGLPEGPVRLAPQLITLPGPKTATYKNNVFQEIQETGIEIAVGIGNRASDIKAYGAAHVPLIFIKRPEFDAETKPLLDQKQAVGFSHYLQLLPYLRILPKVVYSQVLQ